MRREMLDEYRSLIPQVPDVGGRRNRWSSGLTLSAWALAVYRVVLRRGGDAQDAGKVAYDYVRGMVGRVPGPLRARMLGPRRARAQSQARWTQQRRYPGDWVSEVVDSAGQPFDLGMDVTECGIVKFLHAQGADELTPYLCHLDYVTAEAAEPGSPVPRPLPGAANGATSASRFQERPQPLGRPSSWSAAAADPRGRRPPRAALGTRTCRSAHVALTEPAVIDQAPRASRPRGLPQSTRDWAWTRSE